MKKGLSIMSQSTIVINILAKVQNLVTGRLPRGSYGIPTSQTLIALAKDLGYIEGRRGRSGGFEATDMGLKFAGIDAEDFRQKEALDFVQTQHERAAAARKAREERIQALQKNIEAVIIESEMKSKSAR